MPTYFVEERNFTLAMGGLTTSIFLIIGAFAQPVGGFIADKVNQLWVVIGSIFSASLILLALNELQLGMWFTYFSLILLGFALYISTPAALSMVKKVSSSKGYGRAFGINFTTMAASGSIAPLVVGYLGDKFSLDFAFSLLPAFLILAGIPLFLVRNKIDL